MAPGDADRALIVAIGGALSMVFYLQCVPWDLANHLMIGAPFGRDFVNFWEGGHLAVTGHVATLAEPVAYNHLIATTFGHVVPDTLIFSYPPHILLFLAPLGCLPYGVALAIWTLLNLAALAAACRMVVDKAGWTGPALLACTSPAVLMMVIYGHFGGLIALAMAVAILDDERRPIVAGLCLAALSVKPQFAVVLGAILLLAGRWRCLPVAATATVALVGVSAAMFGLDAWLRFLDWTLPQQGLLLADNEKGMLGTVVSAYAGVRALHLPASAAWLFQLAVAGAAMAGAVGVLRRGADRATTLLVVPLATIVAQPYANHYDLAIVAPALTVLLFETAGTKGRAVLVGTWLVVPLTWQLVHIDVPLVPALIILTLASVVSRALARPALFVGSIPEAAAAG